MIIDDIRSKSKEQYDLFQEYLKQLGFYNNVGIVDIGWHNSIQKNLENIIDESIKVNGYYIGVYDDAKSIKKGNTSEGYIFSYGNDLKKQFKAFSFVSLFELFFLSSDPTTIRYEKKNNEIIPVFAPNNHDIDNESKEKMKMIQTGALDFINKIKSSDIDINIFADSICVEPILELGTNIKKKDLVLFENINFENYGVRNIINYNHNSFYYLTHPKQAKNDFFKSGWRIMFLKKLIKLPINYNFIFYMICKVFKRG